MIIDSTKYFCTRGDVSTHLNLIEAPINSKYRYDGEYGKYYFGACYFDSSFGLWLSPDPANGFIVDWEKTE
jgi:hypothetical protein